MRRGIIFFFFWLNQRYPWRISINVRRGIGLRDRHFEANCQPVQVVCLPFPRCWSQQVQAAQSLGCVGSATCFEFEKLSPVMNRNCSSYNLIRAFIPARCLLEANWPKIDRRRSTQPDNLRQPDRHCRKIRETSVCLIVQMSNSSC